ncbi:electron transport complex subunit RsxE [Liberiplasma polymorphum]|uniref:electron transport complex subunit RsxE n=1 Tax=Liberiplasma polymorphum TaxID=3374570 RepID=UPI0037742CE2
MADKNIAKKVKDETGRLANLTKGFVKENPIFVFLLGMCPALAVTSFLETSLGMGILVIFVLISSNVVVSLIKNLIPAEIKIPAYIVVISTFVTVVGMLTEAFAPALHESLGIFIPLIVVNCLILGRAESYASKNGVLNSAIDGLGMALGFTFALVIIGFTREFLATGAIGYGEFLPLPIKGSIINLDTYIFQMAVFAGPAGGFIVIGGFLALFNGIKIKKDKIKDLDRQRMIEEKKRIALERKRQKELESAGGN